jgi:hypothetical protein
MQPTQETIDWMLDSDPALKWQVERDILGLPESEWQKTRGLTATDGIGARLLALQDEDGQWAGGAYFPTREDARALPYVEGEKGQPYIATTWTLNSLREWGVDASALGDTADRLDAGCKWEYDDLPYWGGEVDCCINAFTVSNGAWLGRDMSANVQWFLEHQLEDGGWNCEWIEGDLRSSFHSTLNSLAGLLDYELRTGKNEKVADARKRAEEYLLQRRLMFRLSTGEPVGPWLNDLAYPLRWNYTIIRALNYFRDSAVFSTTQPDPRIAEAAGALAAMANENGRWVTNDRIPGQVWFDVDTPVGEESKWLTFFALRALAWAEPYGTTSSLA